MTYSKTQYQRKCMRRKAKGEEISTITWHGLSINHDRRV